MGLGLKTEAACSFSSQFVWGIRNFTGCLLEEESDMATVSTPGLLMSPASLPRGKSATLAREKRYKLQRYTYNR